MLGRVRFLVSSQTLSAHVNELRMDSNSHSSEYQGYPFWCRWEDNKIQINDRNVCDTTQIKCSEIPEHLRNGFFFESLNESEMDDSIEIPTDSFSAQNDMVTNIEDLTRLLRATMFWDLHSIPESVLSFCRTNHIRVWDRVASEILDKRRYEILKIFTVRGHIGDVIRLDGFDDIFPAWLKVFGPNTSYGEYAVSFAAKLGALAYIKVLRACHYQYGKGALAEAAAGGKLDCLQYLHENHCQCHYHLNFEHDEECDKYLDGNKMCTCSSCFAYHDDKWSPSVCTYAAKAGSLKCLQYAHEHGCLSTSDVLLVAMEGHHVDCMQYILDNGCPVDSKACILACSLKSVLYLDILLRYGAEMDEAVLSAAAKCDTITCLQFLVEQGWVPDENTIRTAAVHNRVASLKYLFDIGCRYGTDILKVCARHGSLDCLFYLLDTEGLSMDIDGSLFASAMYAGHVDCVKCLIDFGCPTVQSFTQYREFVFCTNDSKFAHCIEYAMMHISWLIDDVLLGHINQNKMLMCMEYLRN